MSGPIQCQSNDPNLAGVAGGNSSTGNGVYGWSQGTDGVRGVSLSPEHAGVAGTNDKGGSGMYAKGSPAGFFAGDVVITGSLSLQGLNVADLLRLVQQLEQQVSIVQQLEQRVSDIQSTLNKVKSILNL